MIDNLLMNAVKFSPADTPIDILISAGKAAAVTVRDYGPGIPANERPHVFDRFWRAPGAPALGFIAPSGGIKRQSTRRGRQAKEIQRREQ